MPPCAEACGSRLPAQNLVDHASCLEQKLVDHASVFRRLCESQLRLQKLVAHASEFRSLWITPPCSEARGSSRRSRGLRPLTRARAQRGPSPPPVATPPTLRARRCLTGIWGTANFGGRDRDGWHAPQPGRPARPGGKHCPRALLKVPCGLVATPRRNPAQPEAPRFSPTPCTIRPCLTKHPSDVALAGNNAFSSNAIRNTPPQQISRLQPPGRYRAGSVREAPLPAGDGQGFWSLLKASPDGRHRRGPGEQGRPAGLAAGVPPPRGGRGGAAGPAANAEPQLVVETILASR